MKKLFLNDKFILSIILLNAIVIFLQETHIHGLWLDILDIVCTLIFIVEMVIKHVEWGFKKYWSNGFNRMDGVLVLISLPSLVYYMFPDLTFNFSVFLVLRLLRVFRFFRVFHLFPNFEQIVKNVHLALKESFSVFVGFAILLIVFALISCALFCHAAPEYFGTPLESIYSLFRLCTIEGWYDILDAVADGTRIWSAHFVRIYFIFILIALGIIGVSIINSIFVDAMVRDNNDNVEKQLKRIEKKLDELSKSKNE